MRFFRIIFVSLIAIGVCGGVYLGLTFALAAYMSYKTGGPDRATSDAGDAPVAAAPDAAATPPPHAAAQPSPGVEDAVALLRRTWMAPRRGLTAAPPLVSAPTEQETRIIPVGLRLWTPGMAIVPRRVAMDLEATSMRASPPGSERTPVPVPGTAALPEAIVLPAVPPMQTATPRVDRLPLSMIAVDRSGERPSPMDDAAARASEALLLQTPPPPRRQSIAPETLAIPEPNPYASGPVRTELGQESLLPAPPDRPEALTLPAK